MLRTTALILTLAVAAPALADDAWIADFDKLWLQRDDPKVLAQLYKIVEPVAKADEKNFEANWRLASLCNWDSNNYPDGELKAGLGKRAWHVADKAIAAKPDDVRGQYNAAVGIGLYSEGIGILQALTQGLEGEFKTRIQAAMKTDKNYLNGAPVVVWGRYFWKLPWPKRDVGESIKVLTQEVADHPANLRGKYYLAVSLFDDGQKAKAKALYEDVANAPLGADPAEDKRVKFEAQKWFDDHKGDF
jgi:hypothetical protein